ncbi:oligosaccharide flippase family protein [Sediminicoccus sp. KRV36]|uniref:oligosaccharide flippase family protein n=1 Tax=Sediminicoccus sp. KRV36 TaxID=3133721 RepID=UPI00200FB536|nr:oligosaccharide flippase family protein [Sediminicoccus rosea]UPY36719.1 oligosaccharide flippase family protein [Sediminicoccus rosea]
MNYGKNVGAQAISRILYILTGAIVFVLLARLLGPEQLGAYAWAVTTLSVACSLADLGMTPILARDLVMTGDKRREYLANFLVLRLILGLLASGVAAIAVALLAPDPVRAVLLICMPALPLLAARFFDPVFQVIGRPWLSLLVAAGFTVVAIATTLAALLWPDPLPMAVLAYVSAGVLYGAAGLALTVVLMRPAFNAVSLAGIAVVVRAVLPMALSALIAALSSRIDLFVVAELGTPEMLGLYGAAGRFIDLGIAVVVTVLTPLMAIFTALANDRERLLLGFDAMMRLIATCSLVVGLLAIGFAAPVLTLVYGDAFAPASATLALFGWRIGLAFVNLTVFALVLSVAPIGYSVWNMLLALLVTAALSWLLVPWIGIEGAALATLVSEVVQLTVNLVMARRAVGRGLEPVWWRRFLLAALPAILMCFAPLPGPVSALMGVLLFLGLLAWLRALPVNPLPALALARA